MRCIVLQLLIAEVTCHVTIFATRSEGNSMLDHGEFRLKTWIENKLFQLGFHVPVRPARYSDIEE